MATLVTYAYPPKSNGDVAIALKLTHKGVRKFRIFMVIGKDKLGRNGKIKDERTNSMIMLELSKRKIRLAELDNVIDGISAEQVFDYVFEVENRKGGMAFDSKGEVDFFEWYKVVIDRKREREGRTWETYKSSMNSLLKFVGKDRLPINSVTKSFLMEYMRWMRANGIGERAVEQYMTNHKHVHSLAKREFNDEEAGDVRVRFSPFDCVQFKMSKAEKDMRKARRGDRVISAVGMRHLWELPYHPQSVRANIAKDAFVMSFCLCGMNACDMMEVKGLDKDGRLDFYRKKTRMRAGEGSRIVMPIPEFIRPIMAKYRGTRSLFNFTNMYSSENTFNTALNMGIKMTARYAAEFYAQLWGVSMEEAVRRSEIPLDIDFGFARHAFASVAGNECHCSLEDIDKCLCHSIDSLAWTEYIKRDFGFVERVQSAVIEKTFGVLE